MEERHPARRYARFIMRNRIWVILLISLSTFASLFYVSDVNLRNDPDSLLPLSNRYIATNLFSENHYGMGNLMVWGLKVKNEGDIYQPWFMNIVDELYDDVTQLDYANSGNFIGIPSPKIRHMGRNESGSLEFKRLIPINGLSEEPEELKAQMAYLKDGMNKHPVMETLLTYHEDKQGNKCHMLNSDGMISNQSIDYVHNECLARATFIVGDFRDELKENYLDWISKVREQMAHYEERYGDRVEFYISGEPYFLSAMVQDLVDKAWLFGISLIIIIVILWLEFRHWSCAVFPIAGVSMSIIMTLGLMGFTQFKLTTMMVLTPVLLLAIGIGHSMQITRRYMYELQKSGDPEKAAEESIRHTIVPAFLSIGTDLHGFFALSFVDISFYKAYAYFGIFGMTTLIFTTTTLIPLLLVYFQPTVSEHDKNRAWENKLADFGTNMLTGKFRWVPVLLVSIIVIVSANYAGLGRGVSGLLAGEEARSDPEIARIQDEFDIMPDAEKGINYPRAAFKDEYLLGELIKGDRTVKPIYDLVTLSQLMPGVITTNLVIRSKAGTLPPCGINAWSEDGVRLKGPEECYDEQEDPAQGIFNDPVVLNAISEMEDWMRKQPYIGYTASYVQFLKTLNMMLNAPSGDQPMEHMNLFAIPTAKHIQENLYAYKDPDDPDYLPDPGRSVQLYNGMMENNTAPGDLDAFVNTRNWDEAVVMGFVNTMDPVKTHKTIVDIQNYLIEHKDTPGINKIRVGIEAGEKIELRVGDTVKTVITEENIPGKAAIGGFLGVTEATRDIAFEEFLKAPAGTSFTVFVMTLIMFRSWLIASVLISMCFITLLTQYGLGGYMTSIGEWSANLAFHVQVALSIAMGLGVDYGVYMIARLREEMLITGKVWKESLRNTIRTTGSAIVISVIVLLGSFIPLMNTELANLWSVSLYIGEALILDVLTAIFFLPLVIWWLKPKFVFKPEET